MKNILPLCILMPFFICAQTLSIDQSNTYAVVVGISDYQDENIPDLRFADKDALAFAGFLQSSAGGALDEDHMKVLINEQATVAQFAISLDWLWEVVKENDRVIIYFSGHGDVEKKSLTQPGYLLCWDAPSRVYMAGGAFNVRDLKEVVSTLSIQNKAKVVLITDACRSGNLSGSGIGGAQATAANLSQQYANEIKILSCQPDEYSIEGEQWGGGRGAFSYHLLDGLAGMADGNEDRSVNLKEIGRYLEDRVTAEVAPQSQNPMIVGNKTEKLTNVFPEILAQLKDGKRSQLQLFTATDSRGIEDDVLTDLYSRRTEADTNIVALYFAFKESLSNKNFLEPADACADFYYEKLSQEPALEKLHSSMRRNYAAALQDDAQQVMNRWVMGDMEELSLSKKNQTEKYKFYPSYIERAAKLLGDDHYMYPVLKARSLFFEAYLMHIDLRDVNKPLGKIILSKYQEAIQWQPDAAHVYSNMAWVYYCQMEQPDSAEIYAHRATELIPTWSFPYSNLGFLYSEIRTNQKRGRYFLELADRIDSTAARTNLYHMANWGAFYNRNKQYTEAVKLYNKIIQLDSTNAIFYNNLGLAYYNSHRIQEAEVNYKKAIHFDSTRLFPHINLGLVYFLTGRNVKGEDEFKKVIQLDSTYSKAYSHLGSHCLISGRYAEAEEYIQKAIQLDSTFSYFYNDLGLLYMLQKRFEEAEKYYKKAIQVDSTFTDAYYNLGIVYQETRRYDETEKYYKKAIQIDSTFIGPHNNLGNLYKDTRRFDQAEKYYKKTIQIDSTIWQPYANLAVLYQSCERWEESETAMQKSIKFAPPIWELRAILGNAYTHLPGKTKAAKKELDKVVEMSPDSPDAYIYLAQWSLKMSQSVQAWQYLEHGLEKGFGNGELKLIDLQEGPDFKEMRKDPRWNELIQQYFPDQTKE